MKCFDCGYDLNSVDDAYVKNFIGFKKWFKIVKCGDCARKDVME